MNRHHRILQAAFDGVAFGLPMSARISRSAAPLPAGGDAAAFAQDIQLAQCMPTAELRIRDTAAAEALQSGRRGTLTLMIGADTPNAPARIVTLTGAVLLGVDLEYSQSEMAVATLRFAAASADGLTSPLSAAEAP